LEAAQSAHRLKIEIKKYSIRSGGLLPGLILVPVSIGVIFMKLGPPEVAGIIILGASIPARMEANRLYLPRVKGSWLKRNFASFLIFCAAASTSVIGSAVGCAMVGRGTFPPG
jgi:hypothetical protein